MKSSLRLIVGLITFTLILTHLVGVILLFSPIEKALAFTMEEQSGYVSLAQVPLHARQAFSFVQNEALNVPLGDKSPFYRQVMGKLLLIRGRKIKDSDQRFEFRLNTLNFGGGLVGLQSASQYYFKKPVTHLSVEESQTLAGIFQIFREF